MTVFENPSCKSKHLQRPVLCKFEMDRVIICASETCLLVYMYQMNKNVTEPSSFRVEGWSPK